MSALPRRLQDILAGRPPTLIEKVEEPWQATILSGVVDLLVDSAPGVVSMTTSDGLEVTVSIQIKAARRA